MISVIIPANNEGPLIAACLRAVLASTPPQQQVEIIVVANGCSDDTAARALSLTPEAKKKGWVLQVLDLPQGGKMAALNAGDTAAQGPLRVYLDADVIVSPLVLSQLETSLSPQTAVYASGTVTLPRADSWVTRAYGRFYLTVPFMSEGVPGCGLFAVNQAGRARWGLFPDIISDDTYVRLCFSAAERHAVPARYDWPLVEGWRNLVKVRRRQNLGVSEIQHKFADLLANDDKLPYGKPRLLRNILRDPIGFAVYATVALMVRLGSNKTDWSRGR